MGRVQAFQTQEVVISLPTLMPHNQIPPSAGRWVSTVRKLKERRQDRISRVCRFPPGRTWSRSAEPREFTFCATRRQVANESHRVIPTKGKYLKIGPQTEVKTFGEN